MKELECSGVLFDNDGTLLDSIEATVRCWRWWADKHDVDPRQLLGWHGTPARALVAHLFPNGDVDELTEEITRREIEDTDGIAALPGSIDALSVLAPVNRCAIVTSAVRELAESRLQAAGISIPDVMVTVDDVVHGKPSPEPYLLAATRLGLDPTTCVVVEDAPSGLEAGAAAGAFCIGVTTSHTTEELAPFADAIVPDLSHLRFEVTEAGVRVSAK